MRISSQFVYLEGLLDSNLFVVVLTTFTLNEVKGLCLEVLIWLHMRTGFWFSH